MTPEQLVLDLFENVTEEENTKPQEALKRRAPNGPAALLRALLTAGLDRNVLHEAARLVLELDTQARMRRAAG